MQMPPFKIIEEIAVLKTAKSGWRIELNFISWNDKEPMYDIRWWSPQRKEIGKGVKLTPKEFSNFVQVTSSMQILSVED